MQKIIFGFLLVSFTSFCQDIKNTPTEFTKFEYSYIDEYSWMENIESSDLKQWIESQNTVSNEVLKKAVKKNNFLFKIKDYDYLSTNGLPRKVGKYFYSNYLLFKDKPYVLHYREKLNDMPKELVDPYRVYKDNNALMLGYKPSKNSTFLAYKISLNGSDVHEIRFVDIINQEYLDDVLRDIKFSNITWKDDDGIFYKKNSNKNRIAKDSTFQLYYHKLGDLQEKDKLVFDASNTESSFSVTSQGGKTFLIETNKDETEKSYYLINQLHDETFTVNSFLKNDPYTFTFDEFKNDYIFCRTDKYPWGSVSKFSIKNPEDKSIVIPQTYGHLLINTYFFEDYIIAKYKTLGRFYINIYDFEGKFIRKFEAPYGMDFSLRFYDKKTDDLFVTFYSNTISYLNYRLNITSGKTSVYYNDFIRPKPTLFPFDYFETKTITYKSRDNKNIPITIIHKKGAQLDGNNPTLLKAYGGFGSISLPHYDTGLLCFLEKGGIYAYAEIRGGGDKGTNWHKKGRGQYKMNSFNDFIDAAEFLIQEGYTSPDKLAITGGSHGGLVVGVALIQRPDLFKVAVPKVGVYDMLRFNEYTVGKFHLDEFGDPNIENDFNNLLKYSPLHNIKEDVNYPTTLILTSENDDRVPPIHSYKFAAKLQNRIAQKNAIYLQVKENSGHYGSVSNYKNDTYQEAEFYSFIWEELNK